MKKQKRKKNILFLAKNEIYPLCIIRCVNRKKYNSYVMGAGKQSIALSKLCRRYIACDSLDLEQANMKIVKEINEVCRIYNIHIIIPLDFPSVVTISKIERQLIRTVFPVSKSETLFMLNNKWRFAQLLDKLRILHPRTILVATPEALYKEPLQKPFMIKPLDLDSGKGIKKITSVNRLKQLKKHSEFKEFPLLAQKYIPGYDIDLSILAKNGKVLAWTIQKWEDGVITFVDDPKILSIGGKIVRKTDFSGIAHFDMRIHKKTGKIYVIECNPRMWGSISGSVLAGVDFIELGVQSTQGKALPQYHAQEITYHKPPLVLKGLIKNPFFFSQISTISRQDFIRAIQDPLPYSLFLTKRSFYQFAVNVNATALVKIITSAYLSLTYFRRTNDITAV